ncbi:LuxR C-terminal-related transcriptional regulator [Nocardia cerradoensis]|uniref:LuxR C-terminal-related transcriptional regulator n=1 Tax=Nocardia cerradoensis TaxID=85688 RepID=UPI001679B312|nr:LuxR C-terminal-related transcriptional regulator [Nocardia cerradoensis]
MPIASWTSAVDEPFAGATREVVEHASDLVGAEGIADFPLPRDARLTTLRTRLLDLINSSETAAARRTEACAVLAALHRLQHEDLETALAQQLSSLSEIRDSISALAGLSPRQLIDTVPAQVCRDLALGRAMISTISGSVWLPQHLHIEERTAESATFEQFVDGARIPLSDAPLETELLVRRRTVALVPDPVSDKRTYKQIVDVAQTRAYVAAPITVRGRTIGMLHADRPEDPNSLSDDGLELLAAFAECLSTVFESACLADHMAKQFKRAADTYAEVVAMFDDSGAPAAWCSPQPSAAARRPVRQLHSAPTGAASLTFREREVLGHLATGATNMQIARNLTVSEATVKSHLKQISKKLGTSNRAAAVAAYARMTQEPCGIAQ